MKILYIAYGVSGSGKSTLCRKIATNHAVQGNSAAILSTDAIITSPLYSSQLVSQEDDYKKYIVIDDEIYTWSPDGTRPSHLVNQIKCRCCMERNIPVIIIDNINLTFREIEPYIELAIKNGYEIEFIKSNAEWTTDEEELFQRNLHRVPKETIKRQLDKFLRIDLEDWRLKIEDIKQRMKDI